MSAVPVAARALAAAILAMRVGRTIPEAFGVVHSCAGLLTARGCLADFALTRLGGG